MANILVIDDDPYITALLEQALSSDTDRVQIALSGRAGLRLLQQKPFDLVITDIIMPEFDGVEVIMKINEMRPRPRVIAMTGGSASLSREYLQDMVTMLCVQQVLYKPFTVEKLRETVERASAADAAECI